MCGRAQGTGNTRKIRLDPPSLPTSTSGIQANLSSSVSPKPQFPLIAHLRSSCTALQQQLFLTLRNQTDTILHKDVADISPAEVQKC